VRGLIAVLALGASMCTSAPSGPTRYVNLEKDAHGERRALPFWVSSDAMQHCLEQGLRGLNAGTEARQAFDGAPVQGAQIIAPVDLFPQRAADEAAQPRDEDSGLRHR